MGCGLTNPLNVMSAASRHGRLLLVAGLVAGVLLPGVALAMKPWLPELVALLLFLAAARIGFRRAFGALRDLPATLMLIAILQVAAPLAAIAIVSLFGWQGAAAATALVLMLSGSSISGAPNLTLMMGADPAPALRALILGTALLPLTVLPTFWLLPQLGSAEAVLPAAGRLLAVIALAAAAGFAFNRLFLRDAAPQRLSALDGVSAIAMAVIVVGLMSAVGPALQNEPARFALWLGFVFAANFGCQIVASFLIGRTPLRDEKASWGVVAGNRNIALFLVALPASVTDPLLLFIGCYQIPMYLTPLLLGRFHRRR